MFYVMKQDREKHYLTKGEAIEAAKYQAEHASTDCNFVVVESVASIAKRFTSEVYIDSDTRN